MKFHRLRKVSKCGEDFCGRHQSRPKNVHRFFAGEKNHVPPSVFFFPTGNFFFGFPPAPNFFWFPTRKYDFFPTTSANWWEMVGKRIFWWEKVVVPRGYIQNFLPIFPPFPSGEKKTLVIPRVYIHLYR